MKQATFAKLALSVFVLIFLSFMIRGVGQFIVGHRTAMLVAGPVAVIAALLIGVVVAIWVFAKLDIIHIEADGNE